MREAIEQLIEDYERRMKSIETILDASTSNEQRVRVAGKYHAFNGFVHELKEVLNTADNNPRNVTKPERDGQQEQSQ